MGYGLPINVRGMEVMGKAESMKSALFSPLCEASLDLTCWVGPMHACSCV